MSRQERNRSSHGAPSPLPARDAVERQTSYSEDGFGSSIPHGLGKFLENRAGSRHGEFSEPSAESPGRNSNVIASVLRTTLGAETNSPFHESALWAKIPPLTGLGPLPGGGKADAGRMNRDGYDGIPAEVRGAAGDSPFSAGFHDILGVYTPKAGEDASHEEANTETPSSHLSAAHSDDSSETVALITSATNLNRQAMGPPGGRESGSEHEDRSRFGSVALATELSNLDGSFPEQEPFRSISSFGIPQSTPPIAPMESSPFSATKSTGAFRVSERDVPSAKEAPFLKDLEGILDSGAGRERADAIPTIDVGGNDILGGFAGNSEQSLSLPDPFAILQEGAPSLMNRAEAPSLNGTTSPGQWGQTGADGGSNPSLDLSKTNELLQMLLDEVRKGKEPFLPLVNRDTSFP